MNIKNILVAGTVASVIALTGCGAADGRNLTNSIYRVDDYGYNYDDYYGYDNNGYGYNYDGYGYNYGYNSPYNYGYYGYNSGSSLSPRYGTSRANNDSNYYNNYSGTTTPGSTIDTES